MNLVIHDLTPEQWEHVRGGYEGWRVVSDRGTIRPCIGCFSCWNRTPGQCAVKDGYEDMGALIHDAEEVTVISRYTYGGFSGFVKNVFDRSLAYVLPQFEVVRGETHHRKRYPEDKPFSFLFYGDGIGEAEEESARRYVEAVCANIRGHVKEIRFTGSGEACAAPRREPDSPSGKLLLLNASMRSVTGNSARLSAKLAALLPGQTRTAALRDYLTDHSALVRLMEEAPAVVLCTPLYVDGLPSQLIRFLETARREFRGGPRRIYVLANMGLYETSQLSGLFEAVRQWCGRTGFLFCGGLGVSAGELIGVLMQHLPFRLWPTTKIARGMDRLAEAIRNGGPAGTILAGPVLFPRSLYIWIANTSWNRTARKNGLKPEDLYRRMEQDRVPDGAAGTEGE